MGDAKTFSDNKHPRDDVKKGKEFRVVDPHGSPLYLSTTSPYGGDACEHPLIETLWGLGMGASSQ